jgi:hypothetical protein
MRVRQRRQGRSSHRSCRSVVGQVHPYLRATRDVRSGNKPTLASPADAEEVGQPASVLPFTMRADRLRHTCRHQRVGTAPGPFTSRIRSLTTKAWRVRPIRGFGPALQIQRCLWWVGPEMIRRLGPRSAELGVTLVSTGHDAGVNLQRTFSQASTTCYMLCFFRLADSKKWQLSNISEP